MIAFDCAKIIFFEDIDKFIWHFTHLFVPLQLESSATVCRWHDECERKVRAAQDAPLVKVPAVGDSRIREKKTTARKGKGEKVV